MYYPFKGDFPVHSTQLQNRLTQKYGRLDMENNNEIYSLQHTPRRKLSVMEKHMPFHMENIFK